VLIFPSLCKYFYRKVVFMMNLEEIRLRLVDANLKKVAEKAGIHEARVYRLMSGETEPMYETVKALSDYLEGKDRVDA
jgi:DNA-binding phage protein